MAEIETTLRNVTSSQATIDYLRKNGILGGAYIGETKEYKNVSGALEDIDYLQVMGVVAATGKWTKCKSGASDGSQIPRGLGYTKLEDIAIAGEVNVVIIKSAKVDRAMVVFDGTDTFDTIVGEVRMEDLLTANAIGLQFGNTTDSSSYNY